MDISEENNYFFLAFLDHLILNREEIVAENLMFTLENVCDKYKLFIQADNYTTP